MFQFINNVISNSVILQFIPACFSVDGGLLPRLKSLIKPLYIDYLDFDGELLHNVDGSNCIDHQYFEASGREICDVEWEVLCVYRMGRFDEAFFLFILLV